MATHNSELLNQLVSREVVINRSGFEITVDRELPPLRKGYYYAEANQVIAGEAPKDFIRVYQFGIADRSKPRQWPAYIAKVGHKWYPNESITEHLLTKLGQILGLQMAESSLVSAHGQVRFLSRYFVKPNENLVHGAEIFAGHLEDDEFVEEVDRQGATQDFFTFQFIREAVQEQFPDQARSILANYTRMLAFDAIVGNNDRHHYNWGVVLHQSWRHEPYFSPIYDSARALFWNYPESKLKSIVMHPDPNRLPNFIRRYVNNSRPKTGWDGEENPNHFDLIQKIAENHPDLRQVLSKIRLDQLLLRVGQTLNTDFKSLMSPIRREMIEHCLCLRLQQFKQAIGLD